LNNIEFGIVQEKQEIDGIKRLCQEVFDDEVAMMIDDFYYRSPVSKDNVYFYARDIDTNEIVGTLSLLYIPLRYGHVKLKAAEYGVAATSKKYRGLGINKKLTEMFFAECIKKNYNLVMLEGIPYFYRRYGFNYAVPMGGYKLRVKGQNFGVNKENKISLELAESKDVDIISDDFNISSKCADLCNVKERGIINAQISSYRSETMRKEYYLIKVGGTKVVGYLALDISENNLVISDISNNLSFGIYRGVLSTLFDNILINKKNKDSFSINVPDRSKFVSYLKTIGVVENKSYSWQFKILDEFQFLKCIKPVLEERVQDSIYAAEEIEFNYNNYHQIINFKIKNGKINIAKGKWENANGDFKLNSQGAIKLFLGQYKLEEIQTFLPDCQVSNQYRELVEIIFPKMDPQMYMNY